jgi:hypothetical protein
LGNVLDVRPAISQQPIAKLAEIHFVRQRPVGEINLQQLEPGRRVRRQM